MNEFEQEEKTKELIEKICMGSYELHTMIKEAADQEPIDDPRNELRCQINETIEVLRDCVKQIRNMKVVLLGTGEIV